MRCSLLALVVLVGCSNERAALAPERSAAPSKLAGVYAEQWRCDSVATLDALAQVLGGAVNPIDSAMPVPAGVPHPCNYQVQARELELWTFDVDCRDTMKQTADALFAQYRETSREAVQRYARVDAGAGAGKQDAGADAYAPKEAVEVDVGAKGLDHHGRGLIFIDDDAPCYVRVTGKDAARRLELAKLIAKNLMFANAPMTPRAFR
jgi:hypothetical protein